MDRPALQRLLDDIRAGKVDVVVVYKVGRLTRSLGDFAKIIEVFDAQRRGALSGSARPRDHPWRGDPDSLDTRADVGQGNRVQREDPPRSRGRAAWGISERRHGPGARPSAVGRHRDRGGSSHRKQLRDLPSARLTPTHGDPGGLRQFDLRELRDRRRGARHRRRRGRHRVLDRVHGRARRPGGAWAAVPRSRAQDVADAIRGPGRADCLRGPAGPCRDAADRGAQQPGRHCHQAGAGCSCLGRWCLVSR
jgi:hypothetical protein